MRPARRRILLLFLALVTAALAWAVFRGGAYLQHDDELRRADAIFVLAGSHLERPLEAVDLFQAGYAPVIALSPGREERAETLLRAKGIRIAREGDHVADVLAQLGVPRTALIVDNGSVDNTAQEGALLRRLAREHGWHTVIVVTSKFHTRRTGFAMRRALEGAGVAVLVHSSRYDAADPAHWWRRRADARFALDEWQKLIAYRLGLAE